MRLCLEIRVICNGISFDTGANYHNQPSVYVYVLLVRNTFVGGQTEMELCTSKRVMDVKQNKENRRRSSSTFTSGKYFCLYSL